MTPEEWNAKHPLHEKRKRIIHEWEKIHQSRHWGTYPDIHVVRQVKEFLAGWKKPYAPKALDIGCGTGANALMLTQEGLDVTGIDASPTAIERLSERAKDRRLRLFCSDITSCAVEIEGFDFILDNFTLTCVEDPPWDRILSWLKPGGWLVHCSFSQQPKNTPTTWLHVQPGTMVEEHKIWNKHGNHAFAVCRYIKP